MKKTYVKPTAECEEFVANEFVAACWVVECIGSKDHGEKVIFQEPNWAILDGDEFFKVNGEYYYTGDIQGYFGETSLTGFVQGWLHKVTVKSGENGGAASVRPEHPNASA